MFNPLEAHVNVCNLLLTPSQTKNSYGNPPTFIYELLPPSKLTKVLSKIYVRVNVKPSKKAFTKCMKHVFNNREKIQ